ncbi:AraC family transcriptional regulator [Streptomyces rameus]|uniref:AraC family transcriptional regulator n=1 Tax=Streptomyces rameus TaxID=68261 RepID=A0ABN3V6R0_9ACTN
MDVLAGLLQGPKARGAFVLKSVFRPPWSLRVEDRAPVSLVTMVRGDAWVVPDRATPVLLKPGDLAVLRGPDPYTVTDDQGTDVRVIVGPDQRCTTVDGIDLTDSMAQGVRTWGEPDAPDAAVMLSGTYQAPGAVGRRLLDALPALLVRTAAGTDDPLIPLLAQEIAREEPGQELVLDRLLDLLFVGLLRDWLRQPEHGVPAWYQAQSDPTVGPALRLLHDDPARPWTVASLAREVGASRAALARRFSAVVGEPPMAYLAQWRLTLAADLVCRPDTTLTEVARQVGYGSAFALSSAFKRVRGVSPQEYRASGGEPVLAARPASAGTVVLGSPPARPSAVHPSTVRT